LTITQCKYLLLYLEDEEGFDKRKIERRHHRPRVENERPEHFKEFKHLVLIAYKLHNEKYLRSGTREF
jgi:hypothetical protein